MALDGNTENVSAQQSGDIPLYPVSPEINNEDQLSIEVGVASMSAGIARALEFKLRELSLTPEMLHMSEAVLLNHIITFVGSEVGPRHWNPHNQTMMIDAPVLMETIGNELLSLREKAEAVTEATLEIPAENQKKTRFKLFQMLMNGIVAMTHLRKEAHKIAAL